MPPRAATSATTHRPIHRARGDRRSVPTPALGVGWCGCGAAGGTTTADATTAAPTTARDVATAGATAPGGAPAAPRGLPRAAVALTVADGGV